MERRDYEKLKIGDTVYLFKIETSFSAHRVIFGVAVVLKKTGDDEFKVTQIINGRYFKVGDTVNINDTYWKSKFRTLNLYKSLEEGVEEWNRTVRNAEDRLQHFYENAKKGLTKRLIEI